MIAAIGDLGRPAVGAAARRPGFEMGEIDLRIASLEGSAEREDDPADLLPDLSMTPAGHPDRRYRPPQHHHALLGPGPHEASALQPFGEQAQPVAIPPQQPDQIANPPSAAGAPH
jgi:hypothetical protein